MAILLYKEGNTHEIRGVKCEMIRCENRELNKYKSLGYVADLNSLYSFESADTNESGKLSTQEVREMAKKAGIEGWETKRVKTLKKELGYENID